MHTSAQLFDSIYIEDYSKRKYDYDTLFTIFQVIFSNYLNISLHDLLNFLKADEVIPLLQAKFIQQIKSYVIQIKTDVKNLFIQQLLAHDIGTYILQTVEQKFHK